MSKRTLILIAFLLVLTGFFIYLAVSQVPKSSQTKPGAVVPTKKPVPAYTTLMLSPTNLTLSSTTGSVAVMINTGEGSKTNTVTAVQLELQYDPAMITNVTLTPGTFFSNAIPLVNTADKESGKVTYALAVSPTATGKAGKGTLATIQFQSLLPKGATTKLSILPTTLITAQGVADSVFLKGTNATITAGSAVSPAIQSSGSAPIKR
jgi:hypothetical protein